MCEMFDYAEFYEEPQRDQREKAIESPEFEKWLAEKLAAPSPREEREPSETETTPA
jgi:hypothetical protein